MRSRRLTTRRLSSAADGGGRAYRNPARFRWLSSAAGEGGRAYRNPQVGRFRYAGSLRSRATQPAGAIAVALAATLLLAGCTGDPLAEDYLDGGNENYISGSGITEVPEAERGDPIAFTGRTDAGTEVSRSDFDGEVLVVNFWYANCAPCRAEAPDLAALDAQYEGNGASFLGVNIYDSTEFATSFAKKFGIEYPSILDAEAGETRLAFAGQVSPNAVPTTFVLDSQGRIAARILGKVEEKSILDTLVKDVVAEDA